MPTLAETLTALNANIDGALTKIVNDIAAVQSGKLDVANNFDNTDTGLTATTLADAIVELKQNLVNLEAAVGTDAEIDARLDAVVGTLTTLTTTDKTTVVAAVNELKGLIDSNTAAIGTKLDSSTYTAADVLTKLKTVDGATSGLDAQYLAGKALTYFATASALADKADASDVLTPVPAGAVFTDTVYTHPATHAIAEIAGLQTALNTFATSADLTAAVNGVVDAAPGTLEHPE